VASAKPAPGKHKAALARMLHRSYFRSAGLNGFFARRIRPAGIGLCLVLVVSSFIGIGHQVPAVYQIFSLSLGMALIGLFWTLFRNAKVSAVRELPRHATAGERLRYTVRLTNAGRLPLRRAWLAETPPDPRPLLHEFQHQREPGERERNWFDRTLAYYRWQWLLNRGRVFDGGGSQGLRQLDPEAETRLTLELRPLRRGLILCDDLRILLPDPFGLFQRCRKVQAPAATLTVLPRRFKLPTLQLPGEAAFQIGGDDTTNSIGSAGQIVGLRDYRAGDPMRQIHWKSWARIGRPIVKELEDPYYPRYGLILDTHSPAGDTEEFEIAVSIAASFVASLDKSDCLLDLMFIGQTAYRVTAGRGMERSDKLLEILAGVRTTPAEDFESLAKLVLRHRDDLTSCIVILNGWSQERADFLASLGRAGVRCAPLIVGPGSRPPGVPGHWISTATAESDLLRLPRQLPSLA
jgi:uncharacterized protein (DUF58 family)